MGWRRAAGTRHVVPSVTPSWCFSPHWLEAGHFFPTVTWIYSRWSTEENVLPMSKLFFPSFQEYESLEQENTSLKKEIGKLTDEMKHLSEVLKDHEKICPLLHCTMNFVTVPRPDALSSCLPRWDISSTCVMCESASKMGDVKNCLLKVQIYPWRGLDLPTQLFSTCFGFLNLGKASV